MMAEFGGLLEDAGDACAESKDDEVHQYPQSRFRLALDIRTNGPNGAG
jgi:hypothetical protein